VFFSFPRFSGSIRLIRNSADEITKRGKTMIAKNLIQNWSLPNRSDERTQLTLRLPFTEYARLHALKEIFPGRSVNDIIHDLLKAGLDEVVDSLNSYTFTVTDFEKGQISPDEIGQSVGDRVRYDAKLREILESKSTEESSKNALRVVESTGEAA
jgi:hypothetical protein